MDAPPQLSITPIRHVPAGVRSRTPTTSALADAIQADGRVYLASALIDGDVWLRPCFVNFRTTDDDVLALMDVARELGERLAREPRERRRPPSRRAQGAGATSGTSPRLPRDVGDLQPVPELGAPSAGTWRRGCLHLTGCPGRPSWAVGALGLGRARCQRVRRRRGDQPADRHRRPADPRGPRVGHPPADPADGQGRAGVVDAGGANQIEQLFPRFNAEEATVAGALSAAEQDELARILRTVARSV